MRLGASFGPDIPVYHSVRDDFGDLLRACLKDERVGIATGPLYQIDPAAEMLRPFERSAFETDYGDLSEEQLAPDAVLDQARIVRTAAVLGKEIGSPDEFVDWARAGLVHEIARRRGLHVGGRGILHVSWKLNATVTGRFGAETVHGKGWAFNPLSMGPEDRRRVRPSDHTRHVAVLDFKAMDVCSMSAIVPGLAELLGGHPDPYQRIAELAKTTLDRDRVKLNFLTWAYGGVVDPDVLDQFWYHLRPVHDFTVRLPHGEFPRMVQSVSAIAFRAGLSRALPLLTGDHFIPMLTVHDELALDVSEVGLDRIKEVSMALEAGASERVGRPYRVGVKTGYTYEEAKNG